MSPIPPLHIQQQLMNTDKSPPQPQAPPQLQIEQPKEPGTEQVLRSLCLRCKKEFDQPIIIPQLSDGGRQKFLAEPKIFKLCQHCRDLQRQRLRRWQKKTKDKQGACRRCGLDIPPEEQKFVLCPGCRQNLRTRKANRAAQGKCVHCLGPLDLSIITDEKKLLNSNSRRERTKYGNYKVCQRCRENDKIRRTNLEKMGNCNRCAKQLETQDIGKHKVCASCRNRKKKLSQLGPSTQRNLILGPSTAMGVSQQLLGMAGKAQMPLQPPLMPQLDNQMLLGVPHHLPQPGDSLIAAALAAASHDHQMMSQASYVTVPMNQYSDFNAHAQAQAQAQAHQYNQALAQAQAQQQQYSQMQMPQSMMPPRQN